LAQSYYLDVRSIVQKAIAIYEGQGLEDMVQKIREEIENLESGQSNA